MRNTIVRCLKPLIEPFPKVALAYRYARDSWRLQGEPQPSSLGFRFIGHDAMRNGTFEPEETRIAVEILKNVDVFINVGANIGYYCCIALMQEKQVVAFEPIQLNLKYLFSNIKANGWESQIEIYPLALSDRVGVVDVYGGGTGASLIPGWAGTPNHYATTAPTTTLDNVLGKRFEGVHCFIVVDIEGAEQLMLEGASSVMAWLPRPIWMVEISVSEHQPAGVAVNPSLAKTFELFWNSGYVARTADKHCRPVHPNEISQIMATGVDTLGTHNFLFFDEKATSWISSFGGIASNRSR